MKKLKKEKEIVWKFTNKRELNRGEFIRYFEKKVFATIRKFDMLPSSGGIRLKDDGTLNAKVLKQVLEKKFSVSFVKSGKVDFVSLNLSDISEMIFEDVLKGDFSCVNIKNAPLYFLSDAEIELYSKLGSIRGKKSKRNKKVQSLFEKFFKKNPDLEQNVVRAGEQLF